MPTSSAGPYRSGLGCSSCGRALDAFRARFDDQGGRICDECDDTRTLERAERAALGRSGVGAVVWGMVSMLCNPFLLASLLAIGCGLGSLRALGWLQWAGLSHPAIEDRRAYAALGIVLGMLHPLLFVGGLVSSP